MTAHAFRSAVQRDPGQCQPLWEFLTDETYRQRSEGFRRECPSHLTATKSGLGAPLAHSANRSRLVWFGSARYTYQAFGRDVLYASIEQPRQINSLRASTRGLLPAPGTLERCVLDSAAGATLFGGRTAPAGVADPTANQQFLRRALYDELGAPLSGAYAINVAGALYSLQIFAGDTVYAPAAAPEQISRLSELLPDDPLCATLMAEAYRICGQPYHPDGLFQAFAHRHWLGTPLSSAYRSRFNGRALFVQVFALDTLYAGPDGMPQRLSALEKPAYVSDYCPGDAGHPAGRLRSRWLIEHPRAPAAARQLIAQAINLIGRDSASLLDPEPPLRSYFQPDHDPIGARLAAMCLENARLLLDGAAGAAPHTADSYRLDQGQRRLRSLAADDPWLPGDLLLYGHARAGHLAYGHINIYIGALSGAAADGRCYELDDAVLNGTITQGTVEALPLERCTRTRLGYSLLQRLRHRDLEQMYRKAGQI